MVALLQAQALQAAAGGGLRLRSWWRGWCSSPRTPYPPAPSPRAPPTNVAPTSTASRPNLPVAAPVAVPVVQLVAELVATRSRSLVLTPVGSPSLTGRWHST